MTSTRSRVALIAITLLATLAFAPAAFAAHHVPKGHAWGLYKPGHKDAPPPKVYGPVPTDLPSFCPQVPIEVLMRMLLPANVLITCASYYPPA